MSKYTSSTFVPMLPDNVQASIKKALARKLSGMGLSRSEYREAMENGMNSRLVDLSETIDIKKYLNMANGRLVVKQVNMPLYKLTYNNYYSRNQTGDLVKEIQSKDETAVFSKARDVLRQIIKDDPQSLHLVPMIHVHKYNTKTKRFRKVYVAKYDYDTKKVVGQSFDEWRN